MADKPSEKNDTTRVLPCACQHPYQDSKYGIGHRLHNWARSALKTGAWRCTVCKKERA